MADSQSEDLVREEQIQRILRQVEAKLRNTLNSGARPLHEIEEEVEEIGEAAKRAIIEDATKELGAGYVGTRTPCSCGARAKYCGSPVRHLITRHGVVRLARAYYHCRSCRRGFCPLDRKLELGAGECSRTVQSLLARFSSHMSFELAARELEAVCGIQLSATTVQTYSKKIGTRIAQEWNSKVTEALDRRLSPSGLRVPRLYVSMDGVMAHIGGEWREVKLGAVYRRGATGRSCQTRYYASLEKSNVFGYKMRVLAHINGSDSCRDVVMLCDGAPWIWIETGKHFPRSTQILDYYHAVEHLAALAHARFGASTKESNVWIRQQKAHLLADQVNLVIENIQNWKARKPANRKIRRTTIEYFQEHRARMLYQTLEERGYYIGSGIIEAGAKTVVKARMGGAGMRWEEPGAIAMMHISAAWKSAGHQDFFKYAA
jgi:hypothetical protein